MWNRTLYTTMAIKKNFPQIKTLGPVVWGWCAYFYSAADGCTCGNDCKAHGSAPFLEWYLQQICKNTQNGAPLVDYLDVHFYPQASGINNDDDNPVDLQHRMSSTKSLYKSGYVDESWINQEIYLIPRMRDMISKNCPSVKFSITEYDFGSDDLASTAVVTAEALAIYGREGVDLACKWVAPKDGSRVETSYRLYTNFDGSGRNLIDGGVSVTGTSSNIDLATIFGIYSTTSKTLYVLMFNKEPGSGRVNVTGEIQGLPNSVTSATRYSFGKASQKVVARDNVPISNGKFSAVLSIFEATILAINLA